jgi:hypothetical protein
MRVDGKIASQMGRYVAFVLVAVTVAAGFLAANAHPNTGNSRLPRGEHMEFIEFDVNNSEAMTNWARGVCHGQSVESLAAFYEVEGTPEAVAAAIARDLPEAARRIVTEVCEAELRKPAGH